MNIVASVLRYREHEEWTTPVQHSLLETDGCDRRNIVALTGFGIIAAIADGFGVDIAFFTREFHHQHRGESMAQRVQAANTTWPHLLRMAADINELPEPHRATIQALVTILATPERERDE